MFEQITLHRNMIGAQFDLGQLAETLLFYQSNLILLDRSSLIGLIEAAGQDNLLRLTDEFDVKLSYHRELFATLSNTKNGIKIHNFTDIRFGGTKDKKVRSVKEEIEQVILDKFGSTTDARKFSNKITDRISSKLLKTEERRELINSARSDLLDQSYVDHAARVAISKLAPTAIIPKHLTLRAIDLGTEGFMINSNIDLASFNDEYRRTSGYTDASITEELITSYIFNARVDAYLASAYMSSYVCNDIESALIKRKFLDLIRKRNKDVKEIDLFQEYAFPSGTKLREAINSGATSFDQALDAISKAKKFKSWLNGINPDEKLLAQYIAEVTKEGWLSKLPPKTIRFLTMTGLGVVTGALLSPEAGTLTGLGLNAIDTFLFDKILKGWKPDQFIQGPIEKMLGKDQG